MSRARQRRRYVRVAARGFRQRLRPVSGTLVVALLLACAGDRHGPMVPEFRLTADTALLRAPSDPSVLSLRTYDGSGQSVHPDFIAPTSPWQHRILYLVLTPYPGGSPNHENPSLYAGLDGVTWAAAPRAPMPLIRPTGPGHLSDPDAVYASARNELFLYYRQVSDSDRIFLLRSRDGAQWSSPVLQAAAAPGALLSPAIVRRSANEWLMWSVNSGTGCRDSNTQVELRRSNDGLRWGAPELVHLPVPFARFAWHIDVEWIPEHAEYWALFPVKAAGSCVPTALYIATSPDGVTWRTHQTPVLVAGAIPEFQDVVYRSTFAYDARSDEVTFWFSGARLRNGTFTWRTAVQRRAVSELFAPVAARTVVAPPPTRPAVRAAFDPP